MRIRLAIVILALICPVASQAEDAPAVTLKSALALAHVPDHGIIFSIGADRVKLPSGGSAPPDAAGAADVGRAFGENVMPFGAVAAVAPATMVVIKTPPADANIYDGMPPNDAVELLAASLTDDQWQKLTSATGLGVSDLQPGDQTQLFTALLAQGKLKVGPWRGEFGADQGDKQVRDLTEKLPLSALRLCRSFSVQIQYPDGIHQISGLPTDGSTIGKLQLVDRGQFGGSQDALYGVSVRAVVPNMPKASQLDYHDTSLSMPVSLVGVSTVADLAARLSQVTSRELIADARIEKDTVTIVGTAAPSASDLLQAMAYCVSGTWRKVGTEYVLTDDIAGIGSRTQMWLEFERVADARRKAVIERASQVMTRRHSPDSISWFGSPLAWTDEQMKTRNNQVPEQRFLPPQIDSAYSKLTMAQQALARQADRWYAKNYEWQYQHANSAPPTANTNVRLWSAMELQLTVPSETFPIDMNVQLSDVGMFANKPLTPEEAAKAAAAPPFSYTDYLQKHPDMLDKLRKTRPKFVDRLLARPAKLPALLEVLSAIPKRAVIVRAKSPEAITAQIRELKLLGFNEVWPVVFENGVASVHGTSLKTAALAKNGDDILDAAIAEGVKEGIAVYPVINLLAWGATPPEDVRDCNILGETSAQVWNRERELKDDSFDMEAGLACLDRPLDASCVVVNPLDPGVGKPLRDLVARVAARPGIAGLVLRETSAAGYGPTHPEIITSSVPLGYNEPMRALFLRDAHIDPIDIVSPNYYIGKANTELPIFNDRHRVTNGLVPRWLKFRREQNEAYVMGLFDLVRPAGTPADQGVPLLIKERGRLAGLGNSYQTGYVSWDSRDIIPAVHEGGEGDTMSLDNAASANASYAVTYPVTTPDAIRRMAQDTWELYASYADQAPASILVDLTGPDLPADQDMVKVLADDMGEALPPVVR